MKVRHFLTTILIAIMFLSLHIQASASCERLTYRESQNSILLRSCGKASVYTQDNNSWVVNQYGMERFGMPEEWLDPGLQGAEVAAFRIEPSGRNRCHTEEGERICVPSYATVLELWIKSDIDFGVKGTAASEFKPWKGSLYTLGELNPKLKDKWVSSFSLDNPDLIISDEKHEGGVDVIAFDSTIRKGLTIVTMLIDGDVTLLPAHVPRALRFNTASGYHEVKFPEAFWQRVINHHVGLENVSRRNWFGGIEEDTGLWLHTREFAQNYNLPDSRLSDELEGALAIVFSMIPTGRGSCGYFSESANCSDGRLWSRLEVYLPPEMTSPYDSNFIERAKGRSYAFLYDQWARYDIPNFIEKHLKRNLQVNLSYQPLDSKKDRKLIKWYGGNAYFRSFVESKIWNTQFTFSAITGDLIDYYSTEPMSYYITYQKTDKCLSSTEAMELAMHKVKIPSSFMQAVVEYENLISNNNRGVVEIVNEKYGL